MEELIRAIDEALTVDPSALPVDTRGEVALLLRRQIRRLSAAYSSWLASFDRAGGAADAGYGCTAAWLRCRASADPHEAGREVRLARTLVDVLPSVKAGMAEGTIGVPQAEVISTLRRHIGPESLAAAEPALAAAARDCPPSVLRNFAATVRQQYAPEAAARLESRQYDERELSVASTLWGMGTGSWWLPPALQATVLTALDVISAPVADDDRTAGQRRADALVTMAELALRTHRRDGDPGTARPAVTVTVGLDALTSAAGVCSRPATTTHGSVIGDDWAQRISCDASVARVVFGPEGQVLDSGRSTRVFTPAQRRAIIARDRHCVWPGCTAPATWCDAHHIWHWSRGGTTSVGNAALLCGRHHDRVHLHGHAIVTDRHCRRTVDLRSGSDPHWRQSPPHCRR